MVLRLTLFSEHTEHTPRGSRQSARRSTFEQFEETINQLFFLMNKILSSKNFFGETLSILTSFSYGSDHPDLVRCNISLPRLLLCEDFQEVPQLKSHPDRSWLESLCNAADGVERPDISSFGEDNNNWDSNEEFNEPSKISSQENREGEHHYRLTNPFSTRDGFRAQKSSPDLVQIPKTVPAKTLALPQSSSFFEDGSKANLPLTVRGFPIGNARASTPPNIFPNGHVLAERPMLSSQLERRDDAPGFFLDGERAGAGQGLLNSNSNTSTDESLAELEQLVAEACSLVGRTLKERQEGKKLMKETERKRKDRRGRKEQQARERKQREARETELMNERVERNSTSSGQETPSQDSAPAGVQQWLCEHYQRLCRVKFSCCGKFFPCHRCHNNSGCPNDNSKAIEACSLECSVCSHQQEVNRNDIDLKFYMRRKRILTLRLCD